LISLKDSIYTYRRMEHTAIFEEQVALTPVDFKRAIKDIDAILLEKFRARIENKCSRHGYVLPNTLKILSRSMGMVERGRFTGNIIFRVQAEGGVINPPDGVKLKGEVVRKNKMGLYVNYRDAIRMIVPRDMSIGDKEFEQVNVGDIVNVEIKKSRFQVNDEYILSVGSFQGVDTRATEAAGKTAAALEAVPEENVVEEAEEEELVEEEAAEEEAGEEEEETGEEEEEAKEDNEGMVRANASVNASANAPVNAPRNMTAPANTSAQASSVNQGAVKNASAGNAIPRQPLNLSPAGKEDN
jgi:hypothetical protein